MPRWAALALLGLLVTARWEGASCLRNVRLELLPQAVEHGREATLRCHYELEQAPLYSLKWYRGQHEFYRYSPSESPPTKVFNLTWISVDPGRSNESQVTIRDVDFPLAGNFSCEVTTDAPHFSTASSSRVLRVVSLPKAKPSILSERRRYEAGDTLRANCSAPPSRPPVRLSFTLNDLQVGDARPRADHNAIPQRQPEAQLELQLQPFHYVNGQLTLRCTARIDGVYEQTSELKLGSGLREPRPERVTSENGAGETPRGLRHLLLLAALAVGQLRLR